MINKINNIETENKVDLRSTKSNIEKIEINRNKSLNDFIIKKKLFT